ncbi:chondroitin AC/alginate lyase [Pseudomassariella vexata]|uniref:Chondroitin AC/alginate lyase n=1 Tax=Pseudomassariella vexata TaxID=1141098 RepID=A0A1Y2DB65_9PEZI|nr:chondroitin AC/alginate lyase [Pseudomassariella vexata]ORY55905.1 chondroitin AC/alginate lyase [Pseudomassariella vexata]
MKSILILLFLFTTLSSSSPTRRSITHPGLLHTTADFTRITTKVTSKTEPWYTGWQKLTNHADAAYKPSPVATLCRGSGSDVTCTQNYASLYLDVSVAYVNAIYWAVTGDTAHADAAGSILDGWSSTLKTIDGSADRFLASGLYGYQLANAGEILRSYDGWDGLTDLVTMLKGVFYPMNHNFLVNHNDAAVDHYWANWDLCNMASIHAIGVLADDQGYIDEAVDYFKAGDGNGAIEKMVWTLFTEDGSNKELGQGQEAGRDQGHSALDFALLGVLAQQSYNQGVDLFGYLDNRILAGFEYFAKYNLGYDVPYTTYDNSDNVGQAVISDNSRGIIRPIGELLFAHYSSAKGLNASWTGAYRDMVINDGGGAEGGGGDYGSTSGGYDQLGLGTVLYRLQ